MKYPIISNKERKYDLNNIGESIFTYAAIITRDDENGGYDIYLPDFDEYTCTGFKESANYMATDLLEILIACCIEEERPLPPAYMYDSRLMHKDEELIYVTALGSNVQKLLNTTGEIEVDTEEESKIIDLKYNIFRTIYNTEDIDILEKFNNSLNTTLGAIRFK